VCAVLQDLSRGYFIRPTILVDVQPNFEIWQTEVSAIWIAGSAEVTI
jgi:acyl-CoA reductase-like NAD-dependent aldehyde dehydrogenase